MFEPGPFSRSGINESPLIVVGNGAVDDRLVKSRFGKEERGQFIRSFHQIAQTFGRSRRGYAVGPDPVIIEAFIQNLDTPGKETCFRRKQVIFVENSFFK